MKKITCILVACAAILISEVSYGSDPLITKKPNTSQPNLLLEDADFNLDVLKKRRRRGKKGAFGEGNSVVSLGYGFPNLLKMITNVSTFYGPVVSKGIGPIALKYEYGISRRVGLGISLAYSSGGFESIYDDVYVDENGNSVTDTYSESLLISDFAAMVRMNFHLGSSRKFDPYIGLAGGANFFNITYSNNDPYSLATAESYNVPAVIALEVSAGCRFFFSDNVGLFVETGLINLTVVQGGMSFKF